MMDRYPLSFLVLSLLGALCCLPALVSFSGYGESLHPVLADPMAGLAFLVSALALLGSGAFPLVIQRLRQSESRLVQDAPQD